MLTGMVESKPYAFSWMNINHLDLINPDAYPEVKNLIIALQRWDRKADSNSIGAGIFAVFYDQLRPYYRSLPKSKIFPPATIIKLFQTKPIAVGLLGLVAARLNGLVWFFSVASTS